MRSSRSFLPTLATYAKRLSFLFCFLTVSEQMREFRYLMPDNNYLPMSSMDVNDGVSTRPGNGYQLSPLMTLSVFSPEIIPKFPTPSQALKYLGTRCSHDTAALLTSPADKLNRDTVSEDKILDFWGEGRIVVSELVTGFTDAYNVNHAEQKISNGDEKGCVIPNRIPTQSYEDIDLSSQIEDNTFRYVTTMGSPVIPAAAKEMYRMARKDDAARIIYYGNEKRHTLEIQIASQDHFVHAAASDQYVESLTPALLAPTLRPLSVMVPINQLLNDFDRCLQKGDYYSANNIKLDLQAYCEKAYSQSERIKQHLAARYLEFMSIHYDVMTASNTSSPALR